VAKSAWGKETKTGVIFLSYFCLILWVSRLHGKHNDRDYDPNPEDQHARWTISFYLKLGLSISFNEAKGVGNAFTSFSKISDLIKQSRMTLVGIGN